MDESLDEFQENFKQLKEKKLKLAQISKFLSPKPPPDPTPIIKPASSSSSTSSSSSSSISKPKKPSNGKLNDSKISKYFVKKPDQSKSEKESFQCPICSSDLTSQSETDRQLHVNSCLDKGFNMQKSKNKFVRHPTEPSISSSSLSVEAKKQPLVKEEPALPQASTENKPDPEKQPSQLDVSIEEKMKKYNENLLSTAVPNCPICGKVLHSLSIRKNHLKKCAQTFHIKTESLVDLVKKQQEKLEKDLAKGLIPTDVYFMKQKTETVKPKKEKITNRVIKMEQPINKQDEHLQVAIALSNSLNPAMDQAKSIDKKMFKTNRHLPTDTPLMLSNDETRLAQSTTRFSQILSNQISYDVEMSELAVRPADLVKSKFDVSKNYLWNRCGYFQESNEQFYISQFIEFDKLLTSNKPNQVFVEKIANKEELDDIDVLGTQTAYLLADLAESTQENVSIYLTQQKFNSAKNITLPAEAILEEEEFEEDIGQIDFGASTSQQFQDCPNSDVLDSKPDNQNTSNLDDNSAIEGPEEPNNSLANNLSIQKEQDNPVKADQLDESLENSEISRSTSHDMSSNRSILNQPLIKAVDLFETSEDSNKSGDQGSRRVMSNSSSINSIHEIDDELNQPVFLIDETHLSTSISNNALSSNGKDDPNEVVSILSSPSECHDVLEANIDEQDSSLMSLDVAITEVKMRSQNKDKNKTVEIVEIDDDSDQEPTKMIDSDDEELADLDMRAYSTDDRAKNNVWANFDENQFDNDCFDYAPPQELDCPQDNDDVIPTNEISLLKESSFTRPTTPPRQQVNNLSVLDKSDEEELMKILSHHEKPNSYQDQPEINELDQEEADDMDELAKLTKFPTSTNYGLELDDDEEIVVTQADIDKFLVVTSSKPKPALQRYKSSESSTAAKKANQPPVVNPVIPDFGTMGTPDLKSELKKFGVKPLSKKQAIKKLVEIYEYTSRPRGARKSNMPRSQSCMDFGSIVEKTVEPEPVKESTKSFVKIGVKSKQTARKLTKYNSDVGMRRGVTTIDEDEEPPVKRRAMEKLDEEMNELEATDEVLSTQAGGKSKRASKTLDESETKKTVLEFLKSDNELYMQVLNYEPIDLEKFMRDLQANLNEKKLNNKFLMKVLDELCVTFTMKNINSHKTKVKTKKKN